MFLADLFIGLGLSDRDSIGLFHKGVRDRPDINVLRCARSGAIFLENDQHITAAHYREMNDLSYWTGGSRSAGLRAMFGDDSRRAAFLRPLIQGKRWLDIGTGLGGVLDLAGGFASEFGAVEPQQGARAALTELGYNVYRDLVEVPTRHYDIITLFHVYEHLPEPIEFLRRVEETLAPGGRIYIEVPHARDALINLYECAAFIDFTLWSEHLILHTRSSLARFVSASNFGHCIISGIQRYPLSNHLHWLAKGRPGGHQKWSSLSDPALNADYEAMLTRLDYTDTLLACVER